MSCCGKSRERMKTFTTAPNVPTPRMNVSPVGTIAFEYTGKSRLTVIGPVTHIRYEFNGFGSRVQVDPRDSPSVATVPALRRV